MDRPISLERRRIDLRVERPFQLGRATVDPPAHEYRIGLSATRIEPQPLKVLVALHDKIGEVVTREELVDRCWDGRIIGEDVINRSVSMLRRFARTSGGFEIETVRGAGYRLVLATGSARTRRPVWAIGGTALAIAAAVGAVTSYRLLHRPAAPAAISVAIVPFTTEHGSGFERTLAADTGNSLARMLTETGFSVSNAGSGSRPTADLLVSGQISGSGGSAEAAVSVEDVRSSVVILSHRLNSVAPGAADLPDQVGANVAGSLSWADRLIRLDERHPSDPAVLSQVLDQFNNAEFPFWRTYEFARRHAPLAPGSALAQWQLAIVTGLLIHGLPLEDRAAAISAAQVAGDRATALAPKLGDFRISWCLLHPQVELGACEDHLRAAMRSDPQAAWAPSFLGHQLNNVGRIDEAVNLDMTSLAQDQYTPAKMAEAVMLLEAHGDSRQAETLYRNWIRLWPRFEFLFRLRARGITERGDFAELYRFEQEVGPANFPTNYDSAMALSKAVMAHSLQGAKAACPKSSLDQKLVQCMLAFAALGDEDDAFAEANSLYPSRRGRNPADEQAKWLADPSVLDTSFLAGQGAAPMRRDPRFLPLAMKVGLLDYWRTGRLPDFCTKQHEPVCRQIRSGAQ